MKDKIAKEAIRVGLNLSREALGVDGSAVIPSVVGFVLKSIGSCGECELSMSTMAGIELIACKQDGIIHDKTWYCPEFKRKET